VIHITPIDVMSYHTNRCVGTSNLPSDLPPDAIRIAAVSTAAPINNNPAAIKGSKEVDIRDSKESEASISISPSLPEPAESPNAKAIRLAREYEGELGASRVAKALKRAEPNYVLVDVEATIEQGGDLGESLAYHWVSEWR
jgi:hypothetical protein